MALKIPTSLKLTQLKSIAFQCGISTSGTKALLTNRLIDEIKPVLPNHGVKNSPARVLSIDMGIRNLAYCILDLPSSGPKATKPQIPSMTAWRRIAVSSAPIPAQDVKPSSSVPLKKEAFDPPTLSAAAYSLLKHTLLPHNPTHILIERQRFRSMGSPHILEWTVRVNMFESMLHAVLQTFKSENIWQGTVIPILPGKVGPFWIEGMSSPGADSAVLGDTSAGNAKRPREKVRKAKSAKLLNKGAKIDLVKNWLETNQMVSLGTPEVEQTAKAYMEKWHRLPGRKKGTSAASIGKAEVVEEMGKLDDLADSLLQGMAWIQWEKNKKQILKRGVEALDLR